MYIKEEISLNDLYAVHKSKKIGTDADTVKKEVENFIIDNIDKIKKVEFITEEFTETSNITELISAINRAGYHEIKGFVKNQGIYFDGGFYKIYL